MIARELGRSACANGHALAALYGPTCRVCRMLEVHLVKQALGGAQLILQLGNGALLAGNGAFQHWIVLGLGHRRPLPQAPDLILHQPGRLLQRSIPARQAWGGQQWPTHAGSPCCSTLG